MTNQMRLAGLTVLLASALTFNANAESTRIVLKCVSSDGPNQPDLIINLHEGEGGTMLWGDFQLFDIVHVNDEHISAYRRHRYEFSTKQAMIRGVGGETWVINRQTGDYILASVSESYADIERPQDAKLSASIYRGRCTKQQF